MSSIATQLSFSRARNIVGGNLGSIPYQDATSSTVFIPIGSNTFVLTSNGTTATWTNPSTLSVGGSSAQVNTVLRTTSADHFLTFVDSNNPSATAESIYTTSSFVINPGISGDVRITGITTVTNTTNATSTTTGALIVSGGVGVGGNLYVNGPGTIASPATISVSSDSTSTGGDAQILISQNPSSNDLKILVAGVDTRTDGLIANDQYIIAGQRLNLNSKGNGTLTNTAILLGGSGISPYSDIIFYTAVQNASGTERVRIDYLGNVGININQPTSTLHVAGTTRITGITTITNATAASSTSTGALQVTGGVGIGGALWVEDSIYVKGGNIEIRDETTSSIVLARLNQQASTAVFELGRFDGIASSPAIDFHSSGGNIDFDARIISVGGSTSTTGQARLDLQANQVYLNSTQSATSTTTGALVVVGGVGVGGNIHLGGDLQVQNASYIRGRTTSGNSTRMMGINAVDTFYVGSVDTPISGGIILTVGNNRNALTISSNDIVAVTTNTNATSTTTGALVVTGGAGIGRELYVGGDIYSRGSLVLPQRIQEFIATASQTTFTVTGGYTVGSVQVFANGIQLGSGAFVASNGTTVVLNSARDTGDIIRVISGGTSSAVNNIQSFSLAMSVAFGV